jgi:tRNA1(Val) A37 N6-methylase TrmN6
MKYDNILGCKFLQEDRTQKITYDSVFLSRFVKVKNASKVIELGSGMGVVLILLKKLNDIFDFTCDGIEIQNDLYNLALKNALLNSVSVNFYNMDLRNLSKDFYGKYDIVIANPPYMKLNNGKNSPYESRDIARREIYGTIKDFVKAASLLLKNRGKLYMIWRSERLQEAIIYLDFYNLPVKILKPIYSSENSDSHVLLIMATKNAKKGLKFQKPLYIRRNGNLSDEIKKIYSSN